jgi:hypothetical protein
VRASLWGYGYLPLPLIEPKATTAGKDVPTGGHCWTLFLNTGNFKGPVAFFTPYFFSSITVGRTGTGWPVPRQPDRPCPIGRSRWKRSTSPPGRLPTPTGNTYARIAPTSFPRECRCRVAGDASDHRL